VNPRKNAAHTADRRRVPAHFQTRRNVRPEKLVDELGLKNSSVEKRASRKCTVIFIVNDGGATRDRDARADRPNQASGEKQARNRIGNRSANRRRTRLNESEPDGHYERLTKKNRRVDGRAGIGTRRYLWRRPRRFESVALIDVESLMSMFATKTSGSRRCRLAFITIHERSARMAVAENSRRPRHSLHRRRPSKKPDRVR